MESFNRLIVAAVYVIGGVIIGAVSLVAFRYYAPDKNSNDTIGLADSGPRVERQEALDLELSPGVHIEQIIAQRAQIIRLQRLLDQKTALLEKKTALLDQKTEEQAALQKELGDAIDLLETLAAEVFSENPVVAENGSEPRPLQTEVERLRTDSEKSRAVAERQQAELDLLMMELEATDEEIVQLQQESESELIALLAEREAFEGVVSTAFAQLGEEAVPVLVGYLVHPQPSVRRWAARTLGEIGPLAREAVPVLIDSLRDPDSKVQEAARLALAQIDKPGE
jgi:hypothetical protein